MFLKVLRIIGTPVEALSVVWYFLVTVPWHKGRFEAYKSMLEKTIKEEK